MTEGLAFAGQEPESGPERERAGNALSVKKSVNFCKAGRINDPGVKERDPYEHFVEERWVSARLFASRDFGPVIVDPCAGFGNIVASARDAGLRGYGSDLIARAPKIAGGRDFLSGSWRAPRRAGASFALVSNPPFGGRKPLIRDIARLALERARHVALLVPTSRLNAMGDWLQDLPLIETLHVRERSSLWPGPIYAAKLAAGETLCGGRADVTWLIFRRGMRFRGLTGWLRRDA